MSMAIGSVASPPAGAARYLPVDMCMPATDANSQLSQIIPVPAAAPFPKVSAQLPIPLPEEKPDRPRTGLIRIIDERGCALRYLSGELDPAHTFCTATRNRREAQQVELDTESGQIRILV